MDFDRDYNNDCNISIIDRNCNTSDRYRQTCNNFWIIGVKMDTKYKLLITVVGVVAISLFIALAIWGTFATGTSQSAPKFITELGRLVFG